MPSERVETEAVRTLAAVSLVFVCSVSAAAQEVADIGGIQVVVNAECPTSLFVSGMPKDLAARVGEPYTIVSWPADPALPPDKGRLPGTVEWSATDESVRFRAVDDTTTWVLFTEPTPPSGPIVLRAELQPFKSHPSGTCS